jgi:hypothetical protein
MTSEVEGISGGDASGVETVEVERVAVERVESQGSGLAESTLGASGLAVPTQA